MLYDNLVTELDRHFSTKVHQNNLEKIKKRELKLLNNSIQPNQFIKKSEIEKSSKINRENKILYEKLLIISERKSPSALSHSLPPAKTLNSKYKKLEADRITVENQHLINRLSYNTSDLSVKKLIKDYKLNEEYRNRISKKKFQDRIKKAINFPNKPKASEKVEKTA